MVKVGLRKPSIKKSVKARTTGKMKRKVKSSVNPMYGKKGTGWINNPKKAAYNKAYNKTTKSVSEFGPTSNKKIRSKTTYSNREAYEREERSGCGCWTLLLAVLLIPILAPFFPVAAGIALLAVAIVSLVRLGSRPKHEEYDFSDDELEDDN
nr:MAG TPA: SdpI/YhfL protein family [Caudoviricetes sp.]